MLHRAVAAIAQAASWAAPAPDAEGVVTFRLAGNLRLEVFSPDGHTVILRAPVCALPRDEREADALVEKALRLAAASGGMRRSILSLTPRNENEEEGKALSDENPLERRRKLELHRTPHPAYHPDMSAENLFAQEAEELLNDMVWWRARLVDSPPKSSVSPEMNFSFPFTSRI